MLRPRPNLFLKLIFRTILFFIIFTTFNVGLVHSEEPTIVTEQVEKGNKTSTLAYLSGVAGILISLGVGYRLRRVYDNRKDELAG